LRYIFLAFIVDKLKAETSSEPIKDGENRKDEKIGNIMDSADTGGHEKQTYSEKSNISLSKRDIFYAGFQVKRVHQLAAAKQLLNIKDYTKQYKMVKVLLGKLFQVLGSSKLVITQSSYIPGQNFPEKDDDLNALAHVVENTAFFGDVLLRLPDTTRKIMKGNKEWHIIVNWSIGFCNETGIFDKANLKLLNLVAQELELVPRDPAYINPYKAETLLKATESSNTKNDKSKAKRKKNRKKGKKGPRLSRSDL